MPQLKLKEASAVSTRMPPASHHEPGLAPPSRLPSCHQFSTTNGAAPKAPPTVCQVEALRPSSLLSRRVTTRKTADAATESTTSTFPPTVATPSSWRPAPSATRAVPANPQTRAQRPVRSTASRRNTTASTTESGTSVARSRLPEVALVQLRPRSPSTNANPGASMPSSRLRAEPALVSRPSAAAVTTSRVAPPPSSTASRSAGAIWRSTATDSVVLNP